MNSKVLIDSAASIIEADVLELDTTEYIGRASVLVNPQSISCVNRTIWINLPIKIDYDRLKRFNRIKSRFPIDCDDYELIPYKDNFISTQDRPLSRLILNKYLLSNSNYKEKIKAEKFILGVETKTKGYKNLINYLIEKDYE